MAVSRVQLVGNVSTGASFAGIVTATSAIIGSGVTINASGISLTGVVTASSFVGALTGTASNVTTNANLTGHVTSVGNAAVLGSFTSAQLATALTDETGSGANVFATSPTLVTPALGTPSSLTLTNATGLPVAGGGTGAATFAANGILFGNGTGAIGVTSVGTAAQVLTSNGTGVAPTFQTLAASSSGLTLLSTVTAAGASTADVETTFNSTYNAYVIVGSNITASDTNRNIYCRLKIGGAYIITSTYISRQDFFTTVDTTTTSQAAPTAAPLDYIQISRSMHNAAAASANFEMHIYNPSSASFRKTVRWSAHYYRNTDETEYTNGVGANTGTAALTGVRFYLNIGPITGTFRLYGIANS